MRDCTLLGVHRGAIPVAVESCRSCHAACGGKLILIAGGLAVIGIDPSIIEAYLDTADIQQWIPDISPPVRLEVGPRTRGGTADGTPVRIKYAAAGYDQRWMVDAGEGLDCDVYARAATRAIGSMVTASPVLGLDERTGAYYAMILLRTGAEGVAAMEGLLACNQPLRVGGSMFGIRRYTHVRTHARRLPEGEGPALQFHRAADELRDLGRRRAADFALTVARVAADRHGCALPCPQRAHLIPHFAGSSWEGAGGSVPCHRVVHQFLRAEVEIWTVGNRSGHHDEPARTISMQDAVEGLGAIRQRLCGERARAGMQVRHHDNGSIRQTWHAPLEAGQAVCMAVAAGGRLILAGPGEVCAITLLRAAWVRVCIPEETLVRAAAAGLAPSADLCVQSIVGGCFATEPQATGNAPGGAGPSNRTQGQGRRQQAGGAAAAPAGAARPGAGRAQAPAARPGLDGWIAEGLRLVEARSQQAPASRSGGGMAEATRAATEILRQLRPGLTRFWVNTLAGWLEEHVRATLARQQGGVWQWEATVLAWLMEQAGIAEMLGGSATGRGDRELATDLMAEARFPAAALRQAPFRMWRMGARACHPGVAMPGARAQNADVLGHTSRAIPEDAAAALADLVRACLPAGHDVVMRTGDEAVGAGNPVPPAGRHLVAGTAGPPVSAGAAAGGGASRGQEPLGSRAGRASQATRVHGAVGSSGATSASPDTVPSSGAGDARMHIDQGPANQGATGGATERRGTAGVPSEEPATTPPGGTPPTPGGHGTRSPGATATPGAEEGRGEGDPYQGPAGDWQQGGHANERLTRRDGEYGRGEASPTAAVPPAEADATGDTATAAAIPVPRDGSGSEGGGGEEAGGDAEAMAAGDEPRPATPSPGGDAPATPAARRAPATSQGTLDGWLTPPPGRAESATGRLQTASGGFGAEGAGSTRGGPRRQRGPAAGAVATAASRERISQRRSGQGRGPAAGRSGRLAIGLSRRARSTAQRTPGTAATTGGRRRAAAAARRNGAAGPAATAGGHSGPDEGDLATTEPDRRRRRLADLRGQQQARRGGGDRSAPGSGEQQGQRRARAARDSGPGGRVPR